MAANPRGAHQVDRHRIDRTTGLWASSRKELRACRDRNRAARRSPVLARPRMQTLSHCPGGKSPMRKPVLRFSGGKDSTGLLRLAKKASRTRRTISRSPGRSTHAA